MDGQESQKKTGESIESEAESIERALGIHAELLKFNDILVIGGHAMEFQRRADELARELTEVLKNISAENCLKYHLPYHPTDIKPESIKTPFPVDSKMSGYDHVTNNQFAANDDTFARADQEQTERRAA